MNGAKNYTANDIERYHSGQLSAAERHALEKAALDDPFLADALEGYLYTQTSAEDNTALQQRLQQRIAKKDEARRLFYLGNHWTKIAALLVLIAGGGWLMIRLFNNEPSSELATGKQPQNVPAVASESKADSVTVFSDAPLTTKTTSPAAETAQRQTARPQKDAIVGQTPAIAPLQIPPSAFGRPLKDSLTDQVFAARERSIPQEEQKEAFFQKPNAPAKKQTDLATANDTIRNFNVSMRRDTASLSEVVVIGYGAQRKRELTKARTTPVVDSLEPTGGWTRFDDYVASNLKEPEELKAKGVKGEVELSFEINKEGEPVNITVTKPLCEKCDEEAIRLLKEGPKWKKGRKKGKVKIKFPLSP